MNQLKMGMTWGCSWYLFFIMCHGGRQNEMTSLNKLLEILGAIPSHIDSAIKNQELDKMLVTRHFQQSIGEVLNVVHFLTQR
jgi:hypothetical protein